MTKGKCDCHNCNNTTLNVVISIERLKTLDKIQKETGQTIKTTVEKALDLYFETKILMGEYSREMYANGVPDKNDKNVVKKISKESPLKT